jgi:Tfp pilus assembly protein PilF
MDNVHILLSIKRHIRTPYFHILLIAVIAFISYSNTFDVPFQFDDEPFIVANPLIKDFSFLVSSDRADIQNVSIDIQRYIKTRCIGYFTLWANYKLGGLDVKGYHIVNLTIHVINATLVYFFVVLTFMTPMMSSSSLSDSSRQVALISGLLFATHPVQTEAVTYIISRFVLLAAMFYLISIATYVHSRLTERKAKKYGLYAVSLFSAVLGMKTKENVFTLPVAIMLYEFIFLRASIKKRVLLLFPFLMTMFMVPVAYIARNVDVGDFAATLDSATQLEYAVPRAHYLFTQFTVIVSYIRLFFFPASQNFNYDHAVFSSFFEIPVLLSFLLLLSLIGLGIYFLFRSRTAFRSYSLIAFGIFWFFLTLSVESSVLPIGEIMVEYRIYLPSVGAIIAVISGACLLAQRTRHVRMHKAVAGISIGLLFVLATATYLRNNIWHSEISLWEDVVRKSDKVRGHYNLGNSYRAVSMYEKAIEQYQAVLRLNPQHAQAHNNLGNIYQMFGQTDNAIEHYELELKLNPKSVKAHYNLGIAYSMKGMLDKAIGQYRIVIGMRPEFMDAHYRIGNEYMSKGLVKKAIEHYHEVINMKPGAFTLMPKNHCQAEAYYKLGLAYEAKGLNVKAQEHFRKALELRPDNAEFIKMVR